MALVVTKRSGKKETVDTTKIERACVWAQKGLSVDYSEIFNQESQYEFFYDEIPTSKIQQLLANKAETKISENWDWSKFAARLLLQKVLKEAHGNAPYITETVYYLHLRDYLNRVEKEGTRKLQHERLLNHFDIEKLNYAIKPENDLIFECMGITNLADRYLLKNNDEMIIEAPQHFFMRVAMGLALAEDKSIATDIAIEFYNQYTELEGLSSTPTLFNSATLQPQLSSCFINTLKEDSLDGIFDTAREIARCSKFSGGTAVSYTQLRSAGSFIKSTGGRAGGVVPYEKLLEQTVRGFDQGGKRPGVVAVYLEVWHKDFFNFLESANPSGDERLSIRDIQLASWINDLFLKRVEENLQWSMFSPSDCPDLHDAYGENFVEKYEAYEADESIDRVTVNAKDLWKEILKCLFNYKGKGWPCFKDTINKRSMTRGYGVVHSSNLCVSGNTPLKYKEYLEQIGAFEKPIKELEGHLVYIWNGENWSNVEILKTSDNATMNLVVVSIDDGQSIQDKVLRCTDYHKWYLKTGEELHTTDLLEGMELETYKQPTTGRLVKQKVVTVINDVGDEETFCFTEAWRNKGLFNGILTGNCTEITLRNDPENTSVCNLGSINLARTLTKESLERNIRTMVRKIDNAITEGFIPIEAGKRFNDADRPLGLGVMGYVDFLAELGIPHNSYDHVYAADVLFEFISYIAIDESSNLGKEKGNFPMFEHSQWALGELPIDTGYNKELQDILDPLYVKNDLLDSLRASCDWENLRLKTSQHMRNSTLLAIAPTATISNIAGVNSCTELPQETKYQKDNLSGAFTVVSSLYRKYNETRPDLVADEYTSDSYFKIVAAAARQKWIDQSQSTNIWVDGDIKGKDLSEIYLLGWRLGLKTYYYLRSKASESKIAEPVQPAVFCSIDNPDCEACQ